LEKEKRENIIWYQRNAGLKDGSYYGRMESTLSGRLFHDREGILEEMKGITIGSLLTFNGIIVRENRINSRK